MRTAAAAHRRLGQVHRQLAAADGSDDSEQAGGMRVVPSRQGHQVSSFPTRRPSGNRMNNCMSILATEYCVHFLESSLGVGPYH